MREHCFPTFSPITTFVLRTTSLTDDKPRAWPKSEAASRHRCGQALAAPAGVVIDRGLAPMAARGLSNSLTKHPAPRLQTIENSKTEHIEEELTEIYLFIYFHNMNSLFS